MTHRGQARADRIYLNISVSSSPGRGYNATKRRAHKEIWASYTLGACLGNLFEILHTFLFLCIISEMLVGVDVMFGTT